MALDNKQCRTCGGWYGAEVGFRKNGLDVRGRQLRHATCIGCEGEARQAMREADPFIRKASSTIGHQAKRFGMAAPVFVATYGWNLAKVAHQMRHAYENACTYCRKPYSGMEGGPGMVTTVIVDPALPPYFDTNTAACCRSCNSTKGNLSPAAWAETLRYWREWEAHAMSGFELKPE